MNLLKTIAIVGTGTAGVTALSHCLAHAPLDYKIISIHDPDTPMLGIGESTTTQIPESLYSGAGINMLVDADELDATVKHGVKYVNWRSTEIYTRIPPPHYAMHFNNFKLKEVCFSKFKEKWGSKFEIIEGKISELVGNTDNVTCDISGTSYKFDYLIDCRGYPTDYTDYDIVDTIPVNHCLVHTINEPADWRYTYHYAHPNGWMFGIPLKTRQGWGYLYNDKITSREDAIKNISSIFETPEDKLNLREFSFKNYKAKKFIDGRIIKSGNRAIFYEPMEAISGWFYDRIIRAFFDTVFTKVYTESQANTLLSNFAEDYELFICYMYHGGTVYNSKFWNITQEKCTDRLVNSDRFEKSLATLRTATSFDTLTDTMPFPVDVWKHLDREFGFKYFT